MSIRESRSQINRQAQEVSLAVDHLKASVTSGDKAPYKGGERTRKAFERNTKKKGIIQDYEGVIPLSRSIQDQMNDELRQFATNLESEYKIMVETMGPERALDMIQNQLDFATQAKGKLKDDIHKKAQFIATNSNLEFVKTAIGAARFKQMKSDVVQRGSLTSFVGNAGWNDVQQQSQDMFSLITKKTDQSKRQLAKKFLAGLEGDEPVNLKKLINEELKITGYRATFIARDQSAKLNSLITQRRMNDFGISVYKWVSTTGDGRTRRVHAKRNNKYFAIGTPTKGGRSDMPGEDYNCRCNAEPVVDEQKALDIINMIMMTPKASYIGVDL